MKTINIENFAEKIKNEFGNKFIIEISPNLFSNKTIYPLTRHTNTNSIWGFKRCKRDYFTFVVNLDFSNKVVKSYVSNSIGINRKFIEKKFMISLSEIMEKEPAFAFDEYTKGKHMSCMLWADSNAMAQIYLQNLVARERKGDGGITNIKYNKNFGDLELEKLCSEPKTNVEIVDFRENYFKFEFLAKHGIEKQ